MLWAQKRLRQQEHNEVTRNLSRPVSKSKKSMGKNVVDNYPFHDPSEM